MYKKYAVPLSDFGILLYDIILHYGGRWLTIVRAVCSRFSKFRSTDSRAAVLAKAVLSFIRAVWRLNAILSHRWVGFWDCYGLLYLFVAPVQDGQAAQQLLPVVVSAPPEGASLVKSAIPSRIVTSDREFRHSFRQPFYVGFN